jgi:hypothetical protein
MLAVANGVPTNLPVAVLVAVIIVLVSRPIIVRVATAEAKPWLIGIMTASLILHLLAAPAQIYVVDHFYHGIADWLRYDGQGSLLAGGFRHFNFSLAPGHLKGIVNDGSVSIVTGAIYTLVGTNQLAGFLVFSWFAFVGSILFFRAFSLTFAGADTKRYAYLLFFLPSEIFWTADASKEAIMMFALGMVSYGAAKFLARRPGGLPLALVGAAIGFFVRPNELLLVVAGFTVAMLVAQTGSSSGASPARRFVSIVFFGSVLVVSIFLTLHYLHGSGGSLNLNQVSQNNATGGSGGIGYSTSPAGYPHDIYVVLFDPLPINFHGLGELIAAAENSVIIVLFLASFRQLRMVPRAAFARAYVMMCLVYSAAFLYTFAALGNLGLITRERTLLFPFLMVLLSIPRTPQGQRPRYEWELRRRDRRRFRVTEPIRLAQLAEAERLAQAARFEQLAQLAQGRPGPAGPPEPDPPPRS